MQISSFTELFLKVNPEHENENRRDLRDAFSDTEDYLEHGLVSSIRCASRTSSIGSWSEYIKPSFTQKLTFRSVLEGEPAVFRCKLVACPLPKVSWFHNNKPIGTDSRRVIKTDSDMHVHNCNLLIKSVEDRDSGSYRIFAINSEGSAECTASLLVALREEQNPKYLDFVRYSEKTHESIDSLVQKRRESRLKVDLRCVGSPFDKRRETQIFRSQYPKTGLVRTISFEKLSSIDSHERGQIERQKISDKLLDKEIQKKLNRLREFKRANRGSRSLSVSSSEAYSDVDLESFQSDMSSASCRIEKENIRFESSTEIPDYESTRSQDVPEIKETVSSRILQDVSQASLVGLSMYKKSKEEPQMHTSYGVNELKRCDFHEEFMERGKEEKNHLHLDFQEQVDVSSVRSKDNTFGTSLEKQEVSLDVSDSIQMEEPVTLRTQYKHFDTILQDSFSFNKEELHKSSFQETSMIKNGEQKKGNLDLDTEKESTFSIPIKDPISFRIFQEISEASLVGSSAPKKQEKIEPHRSERVSDVHRTTFLEINMKKSDRQKEESKLEFNARSSKSLINNVNVPVTRDEIKLDLDEPIQLHEPVRSSIQGEFSQSSIRSSMDKKHKQIELHSSDDGSKINKNSVHEICMKVDDKDNKKEYSYNKKGESNSVEEISYSFKPLINITGIPIKKEAIGLELTKPIPVKESDRSSILQEPMEVNVKNSLYQLHSVDSDNEVHSSVFHKIQMKNDVKKKNKEYSHSHPQEESHFTEVDAYSTKPVINVSSVLIKNGEAKLELGEPIPVKEPVISSISQDVSETNLINSSFDKKKQEKITLRSFDRESEINKSPFYMTSMEKDEEEKNKYPHFDILEETTFAEMDTFSVKPVRETSGDTFKKDEVKLEFTEPITCKESMGSSFMEDLPETSLVSLSSHNEKQGRNKLHSFDIVSEVHKSAFHEICMKKVDEGNKNECLNLDIKEEFQSAEADASVRAVINIIDLPVEKEDVKAGLPALKEGIYTTVNNVEAETEKDSFATETSFTGISEPCPPMFTSDIESREAFDGEICTFTCNFQGYPQPTVSWYNNDKSIPRNENYIISTTDTNSTLTFSPVLPQHEGSITCVIFNQYGTDTTFGKLKVKSREKEDRDEAETLIKCEVLISKHFTENDEEELLSLFENDKGGQYFDNNVGRFGLQLPHVSYDIPCKSDESLSLPVEIKITAPTPVPEYEDESKEFFQPVESLPESASPDLMQKMKHKFTFSFDVVNEAPKLIQGIEKQIQCKSGDYVILECIITGDPEPLVTWYRNNTELKNCNKFSIQDANGVFKLCIKNVSTLDSGQYKFVATNWAGAVESVSELIVNDTSDKYKCQKEELTTDKEMDNETIEYSIQDVEKVLGQWDSSCSYSTENADIRNINQSFQNANYVWQDEHKEHKPSISMKDKDSSLPLFGACTSEKSEQSVSKTQHHEIEKPVELEGKDIEASNTEQSQSSIIKAIESTGEQKELPAIPKRRRSVIKTQSVTNNESKLVEEKLVKTINIDQNHGSVVKEIEYTETRKELPSVPKRRRSVVKTKSEMETESKTLKQESVESTNGSATNEPDMRKELPTVPKRKRSVVKMKSGTDKESRPFELGVVDSGNNVVQTETGVLKDKVTEKMQISKDTAYVDEIYSSVGTGMSYTDSDSHGKEEGATEQMPDYKDLDSKCIISNEMKNPTENEGVAFMNVMDQMHILEKEIVIEKEDSEKIELIKPLTKLHHDSKEKDACLKDICKVEAYGNKVIPQSVADMQTVFYEPPHSIPSESMILHKDSYEPFDHSQSTFSKYGLDVQEPPTTEKDNTGDHKRSEEVKGTLSPEVTNQHVECKQMFKHDNNIDKTGPSDDRLMLHLNEFLKKDDTQYTELEVGRGNNTHLQMEPSNASESGNISDVIQMESRVALTEYLVSTGEKEVVIPQEIKPMKENQQGHITALEVEDVTFSNFYDFYKNQSFSNRPFSPESEMSIEAASISSEEILGPDQFYTPPTSVECFRSPLSEYFVTPVSSPEQDVINVQQTLGSSNDGEEHKEIRNITIETDNISTPGIKGSVADNYCVEENPRSPKTEAKNIEMPPSFNKPLPKRRIYENNTLSLAVEITGEPTPVVKWYRNALLLENEEKIKLGKHGNLYILEIYNMQISESGEYMCYAVNTLGEAKSVTHVEIVPQDGKSIALPPPVTHQHVMEFDMEPYTTSRSPSPQEILLEVELDETEVKDFEKQVKIITIPEFSADSKSMVISLDVLPLAYDDQTVDINMRDSEDVKINFEVTEKPPRFLQPFTNLHVPENSDAEFHCSVTGLPRPVVSWFKENKSICSDARKYNIKEDNDHQSLFIHSVIKSDAGTYVCKAVNNFGEVTCKALLHVMESDAGVSETEVTELANISLEGATSMPYDVIVGSDVSEASQTEIQLEFEFEGGAHDADRAVELVAVTENESEEGGDKCININFDVFAKPSLEKEIEFKAKDSESCHFEFEVTESPPKFKKMLLDLITPLGTPACLQCLVFGCPVPNVTWYKDGELIYGGRYLIEEETPGFHTLKIRNVDYTDEGLYKCVASNKEGSAETSALLKVT
ncbi:uncharacterized protein WCC33_014242 [Rhinophrynus dorsalis]